VELTKREPAAATRTAAARCYNGGGASIVPEGHLIHYYARRHARQLAGHRVRATSPQGRFAAEAATIDGQELAGVEAYGKHAFFAFTPLVHVHLGMAGKWFPAAGPPRPSVRLRLAGPVATWDLVAPIRCELWSAEQRHELIAGLGPDPLRRDARPAVAWERLHASRLSIGAALLDQRIIAGIGNVIRNELLFELRLDPLTPAAALGRPTFDRLWARLVTVMRASAAQGRIVFGAGRSRARHVYKRDTCARCGGAIATSSIGGRTAYTCAHCQR
jgi:endonuclease-8